MDELKLLIDMVANLPTLAVWVLVGYLCYKVAVVGSIYGVIRLLIIKAHDAMSKPRQVQVDFMVGTTSIDSVTAAGLRAQIMRLSSTSNYIHSSDVEKLRKAIDAMLAERAK